MARTSCHLVGCFIGGSLFDRVGHKEIQFLLSCLLRMIAITVAPWSGSVIVFIIALGFFGFVNGYSEAGKKLNSLQTYLVIILIGNFTYLKISKHVFLFSNATFK